MSQDRHDDLPAAGDAGAGPEPVRPDPHGIAVLVQARRSVDRSRALIDRSRELLSRSQRRLDLVGPGPAATGFASAISRPHRSTGMSVALALSDLDHIHLWFEYACLGGEESCQQLIAFLAGGLDWSPRNRDVLAHALNENLWKQGLPSLVDYSWS